MPKTRKASSCVPERDFPSVSVLNTARCYQHHQQKPHRIDYNVALPAMGGFSRIYAAWPSLGGTSHRLGIKDARTWLWVAPGGFSGFSHQDVVDGFPSTIFLKTAEVGVDGLPCGKVVWEASPSDASLKDVQDSAKNFVQVYGSGSSSRLRFREKWLNALKLLVGQVGWVSFAFHTSKHPTYLTLYKHALRLLAGE